MGVTFRRLEGPATGRLEDEVGIGEVVEEAVGLKGGVERGLGLLVKDDVEADGL